METTQTSTALEMCIQMDQKLGLEKQKKLFKDKINGLLQIELTTFDWDPIEAKAAVIFENAEPWLQEYNSQGYELKELFDSWFKKLVSTADTYFDSTTDK
jgi:hypothetical protein